MSFFDDVKEFHKHFNIGYDGPPRLLPAKLLAERVAHLNEEHYEYRNAFIDKDPVGQLDALVDFVYIALGTANLHGFDFNQAFKRVHEANMKKIQASTSRSANDVIKPTDWVPPYLGDLVGDIPLYSMEDDQPDDESEFDNESR